MDTNKDTIFKWQPDNVSGIEPAKHIKEALENNEWMRAGGECICLVCKKEYNRHPRVTGVEWLTELCDGMLVKL